jgi:NAD(P)-dependent dehydrogenase (short-subunit alcohol dehydrogenase family)
MLTIPEMVEREPQRYVAVRLPVVIPFAEEVDPAFDELFSAFARAGVAPDGLEFVKFNLIDMPRLVIETGMTADASIPLSGRLVEGVLPGGRYVRMTYTGPYDGLHVDEWDRMIDVNIKGVLYGVAAVLPHMTKQKSGHIINVSSVAGHKVGPGGAVYAATKHAVRVLSEGLRQEVKPYNIRTTIISPGAVATELTETITDPDIAAGMKKTYEKAIPADAFARAVSFAMSQPDDVDINEILFRPTSQAY